MGILGMTRANVVAGVGAQAPKISRKTVKLNFKNYEGKDFRTIGRKGPLFDKTFKIKPGEKLIIEIPLRQGDSFVSEGTEAFSQCTGVKIQSEIKDITPAPADPLTKPNRKWVFTVELDSTAKPGGKHRFRIDAGSHKMEANVPAYFNFVVQ